MKKRLPLIIALIAAVSLFSITALAFTNNQTGYDTLKEALKSAQHFDNATFDVQFAVVDNNQSILEASIIGKADHSSEIASGQMVLNVNDLTKTAAFYTQDSTHIFVDLDNDLYYQTNDTKEHDRTHRYDDQDENFEMTGAQEAFIDFLAGDLKNQIGLVENSNETKTLTLNLDQKEIPIALNLMISAAASSEEHYNRDNVDQYDAQIQNLPFFDGLENFEKELPELKEAVKVTGLQAELTLDAQNQLVAYQFSITIEGKEANQTAHMVTLSSTGKITAVDQTVVDTIDLTGKDVQIIDCENEAY